MFGLIMTVTEMTAELNENLIQNKTISSTNDVEYPTPIGQLTLFESEGLCIPIPEKNNSVYGQKLEQLISNKTIVHCTIESTGLLIKFAYVREGRVYMLFYHNDSKLFMGMEIINALLLKIPETINKKIIEKLNLMTYQMII